MSVGSSLARRAQKGIKHALGIQYDGEPVWKTIERAGKSLKALWSEHGTWIMTDQPLMAVLEDQRKQFERNEKKIEDTVDAEKQHAHDEIEKKFDRIRDKKILELQLASMKQEYATLQNAITIRTNSKRNG